MCKRACPYLGVYALSVDAQKGQRRKSDPQGLELQIAVSPLMGSWELNLEPLQE